MGNEQRASDVSQIADKGFVERRGGNPQRRELFELLRKMSAPDIQVAVRLASSSSDAIRTAISTGLYSRT